MTPEESMGRSEVTSPPQPAGAPAKAAGPGLSIAGLLTLTLTLTTGFAFRPEIGGSTTFWALISLPALIAAGIALTLLAKNGRARSLLLPKAGDLTVGALVGGALLLSSWAGRMLLAGPGTPQQVWLYGVYVQVGDPDVIQRSIPMTLLVLSVATAEEIVFRGYVHEQAETYFGKRRGWVAAAAMYTLMLAPTLVTLHVPGVGPNPLLFLGALLLGLVLGFARKVSGRLPPLIVAHAVFSYFSLTQFRLPGM